MNTCFGWLKMKILEKMVFEFTSIKWNVILVDETIVIENQIIQLLLIYLEMISSPKLLNLIKTIETNISSKRGWKSSFFRQWRRRKNRNISCGKIYTIMWSTKKSTIFFKCSFYTQSMYKYEMNSKQKYIPISSSLGDVITKVPLPGCCDIRSS